MTTDARTLQAQLNDAARDVLSAGPYVRTEPAKRRGEAGSLVSIVITFFNEEMMIDAFFRALGPVIAELPCAVECICVNDGSQDRTLDLLRQRQAHMANLTIVDLARNFGKEAAMTAGLAQAKGDAAVVIDADLQDPPHLIADFIAKWREGYDIVYGIRASRSSDSFAKRTSARAFYALFNCVSKVPIPDGAGDFRLMDRRVVDILLALPERNRFMKGLFSWVGFRQTGVAFARAPREAGTTKWNYLRLANFALDGLTSFSIVPLRLASLAGLLVSFVAFLYASYLVTRTLIFGIDVPGYASIMVVMMFLGGAQLLFLGIIGEYLGRLYVETKRRPLYLVSDVYPAESESAGVTDREAQSAAPRPAARA